MTPVIFLMTGDSFYPILNLGFSCRGRCPLDLIRLHVLPPKCGADHVSRLVIASPATRIVKSFVTSPWEVFLCPEYAARISIHYNNRRQTTKNKKGK
jgi:hypothetical protein